MRSRQWQVEIGSSPTSVLRAERLEQRLTKEMKELLDMPLDGWTFEELVARSTRP